MTEEVRQALRICPPGLRQAIDRLPDAGAMEELRLRCGQPPACRIAGKERALPLAPVTPELLRGILEQATQRSAYAMQEMTRCGFVTLPGGHRLGICGTAVVQNGTITALREPSSLNLRIARQPDGIADRLRDTLWARPQSVLLCGAPGSGKTTLLRDLIRQLSDRFGWRICVVDERLELAACASGVPQFRLGAHTDVLSGAPKAAGIELLLRTMNPEWIAVDEITAEADIAAIRRASYCGVRFLATAHAADRRELESRPLYRRAAAGRLFSHGGLSAAGSFRAHRKGAGPCLECSGARWCCWQAAASASRPGCGITAASRHAAGLLPRHRAAALRDQLFPAAAAGGLRRSWRSRLAGPPAAFFRCFAAQLREPVSRDRAAAAALEAARGLQLPQDAVMAVLELCSALGRYDLDGENRMLDLTAKRLQAALARCEAEKRPRAKCYAALGLCTGLALLILAV